MDHINRSISVEMMVSGLSLLGITSPILTSAQLKAAERSAGKQFILITPQNMNQVTSTRCKIFRYAPSPRYSSCLGTPWLTATS